MAICHRVDEVDLFQGGRHGRVPGELGGHEDRPELRSDAALPQTWQVRVGPTTTGAHIERVQVIADLGPHLPGQVVVAVPDGMLGEHIGHDLGDLGGVGGRGSGGLGHGPTLPRRAQLE